jgi:predicted nucleotidyltransferase component of viral defense system
MIFKNEMSFKAKINQIAKDKKIPAQQVQQNYLIERFLVRLSQSPYRENFIVKGGYLIGGLIGIESRTTMDLDTTIKGFDLTVDNLNQIIPEVLKVPADDPFTFSFHGVEEIRETDDYPGYRVKLVADYGRISTPLTIDVTTGDKITPAAIEFQFKQLFDDGTISIQIYNLETVIAENLETVIARSSANTRPRDYYDVYLLTKLKGDIIDYDVLSQALIKTAEKRGTVSLLPDYERAIQRIADSEEQRRPWQNYQRQYQYASGILFEEVMDSLVSLASKVIS